MIPYWTTFLLAGIAALIVGSFVPPLGIFKKIGYVLLAVAFVLLIFFLARNFS